jgi:type IV pilus assembly protein PilZ
MKNVEEKRKHPRIELILKVEYESAEDFLADYASNASGGGIFIATNKSFKIGEAVAFSISFPRLLSPISCRGVVRWQRQPEQATEEKPAGIGIEFTFESEEEARRIRDLVDKLGRPLPEPAEEPRGVFRVLLAEDNQMVREMIRYGLKKFHGIRFAGQRELLVVEADDGKQAWDLLQKEPCDLAITDLNMPIMGGEQLIQLIRESDDQKTRIMPVIAISAGTEEAHKAAYLAGADLFLGKPIMLVQLFSSLQRLLGMQSEKG